MNDIDRMTAPQPPAEAQAQVPSYDALLIIAQSVCGALERAGITDCDDPGEAIDVLRERYEAQAQGGGDVAWSTNKPSHPGVYGVRGFNLGATPEEQFEAIVAVRLYEGDLICNLHESTSEDDFDRWTLVEDCNDGFEWCEFTPASAPPSAPVGVAGDTVGLHVLTGVLDKHGEELRAGDRIVTRLEGEHTKPEYWNPEY
ncbi:MAG: hypothetical protein KA742_12785, partial [Pseudoxanthomonas sp.]|nr:hypothetical protein [Pseudoxanthomonas sp.]